MPSTTAKATKRSANEALLQESRNFEGQAAQYAFLWNHFLTIPPYKGTILYKGKEG